MSNTEQTTNTPTPPPPADYAKSKWLVILQALGPLLIAFVGGAYTIINGYYQHRQLAQNASQESTRIAESKQEETARRNSNMATQLLANREKAETDFRQYMFPILSKQILDETQPLNKRIAVFELFENNFGDLFNCRSFFDVLHNAAIALAKNTPAQTANSQLAVANLTRIARQVNEVQEHLIGGCQIQVALSMDAQDTIVEYTNCHNQSDETVCLHVNAIGTDNVSIIMSIEYIDSIDNKQVDIPLKVNNGYPFTVYYFDAPLTDNTLVPDGDRIAIVLDDIYTDGQPVAVLNVIHFPADFITIGYHPTMTRINDLLDQSKK